MATVRESLRNLSLAERQWVEGWLDEFEAAWHPGRLAEQAARLPPAGNPLRAVALAELVKVDLERQWRSGRPATRESGGNASTAKRGRRRRSIIPTSVPSTSWVRGVAVKRLDPSRLKS